jgi:hypothetical protein
MNAKIQTTDVEVLQPASAPTSILEVIERVTRDPTADVAKLEKMLELYERVSDRQRQAEFAVAMNTAQGKIRAVGYDSDNPHTSSRYASYEALDRALRPVYSEAGFSLTFNTVPTDRAEIVRVTCRVIHTCGYFVDYSIDMPADGKGAKGGDVMTKTHATGSAVSYGMRYLLKMIWNVATGERDDDGNAAGTEFVTEGEAADLRALATEIGVNVPAFLKVMKAETFEKIPAARYKDALATLEAKRKRG